MPRQGAHAVGRAALNTPHLERREGESCVIDPSKSRACGRGASPQKLWFQRTAQQGSGKGRFLPKSTARSQRERSEKPASPQSGTPWVEIGREGIWKSEWRTWWAGTPRGWIIFCKPLPGVEKQDLTRVI